MGFQAPTTSDYAALALTSLISYNRPLVLFLIFIISFVVVYFLSKRKLSVSLLVSSVITLLLGLVYIITDASKTRW